MEWINLMETNEPITSHKQNNKVLSSASFLMLIGLMLMAMLTAIQPLQPNDFFPYVRIGVEIVRTKSIPATEFMTYTQGGKPVEYQYWLPSVILWGINKAGGITLTSITVMLCIAAYYFLLWKCLQELEIIPVLALTCLFVFGLTAGSYYIARPQVFAFPLFSLTLLLLIKWQKSDNRLLWLLPIITILWVNLHGSFIVQFFLLVPAIIFGTGNRKKLIIAVIVALFATMVNAYGFGIWKSIFTIVRNEANQIYSLEFQKPTNEGWQANILFGSFLVIPVLTTLLRPKVKFIYWIWFMGFGWMALSGIRYGIWYLGLLIILMCLLLNSYVTTLFKRELFQNRSMNLVVSVFLFMIVIAVLPGIREYWWKKGPPSYAETTPIKAAAWLHQNPQLPGEVWCDFTSCTYLTYALPERKLFMTNRMDDFPVEQYQDYLKVTNGFHNWQQVLDKYNIHLVLFDYVELTQLDDTISGSAKWDEVYRDGRFKILVQN